MLRIQNVTKSFGALTAVQGVSLEIGETAITGLVGPNGSGKSTLFHLVTGFYRLDHGEIFFGRHSIGKLSPHEISRRGLIRSFQHTRPLPFMTVLDNLIAAAPAQTGERIWPLFFMPARVRREENDLQEKARGILRLLDLLPLADELAGRLSYGQQKLMDLGRILMAGPRLILLDEPTAGINPTLIRRLVDVLHRLCEQGIQIFLIEHNMPLVAELCRHVFVMDSGELIFSGTPKQAREEPRVIEAYLGRENHAA
ncbi:MAG TPA: ABC transporter ATP-binding protein [Desulfobacterales bacterium]|jgi:ABC-type branched-subunit amino acid transport system ATPase component|nr:ABC transporter ATP-binding protein [Desulfobacterales bacterium]